MTGEKKYLKELRPLSQGRVTFGDGGKGNVKSIGRLVGPDSSCLDYLLLVEGLTANLVNISQICNGRNASS
jgi:hypothetical protein